MKTAFEVIDDSGKRLIFSSRTEAAAFFKMSRSKLKDRLGRLKWTARQAVNLDPPPVAKKPSNTKEFFVQVDGVQMHFLGFNELETFFGVPAGRIRAAVNRGWSIEAAVGSIPRPPRPPHQNATKFSVEIDGEKRTFLGYSALGKFFDQNPDTIRHKVKAGQSVESAVGLAPPENKRAVTVNAKEGPKHFKSLKAACREFKKVYETVYDRLRGPDWTLEQALDLETHPRHLKRSFGIIYLLTHLPSGQQYVGQTFTTLERRWTGHCCEAGKKSGRKSLVSRLIVKDGKDAFAKKIIGEANNQHDLDLLEKQKISELNTLVPNGLNQMKGGGGCAAAFGKPVVVAGVPFLSQAAAARHHNKSPDTFRDRLKSGETPEQAADLEDIERASTKSQPIHFTYRGKKYRYRSCTQAAKAWNMSVTCLEWRLKKRGWSAVRACTTPPDCNGENKQPQKFKYKNKLYRYDSIRAAANDWELKYATAKTRLRKGWSPRRAFTSRENLK